MSKIMFELPDFNDKQIMSGFGGPGGRQINTKPTPPERGSFPLDHDGECKDVMKSYLSCMKKNRGMNDPECRNWAKSYLSCRMERNLMARDEFKNLGFGEEKPAADKEKGEGSAQGQKGELRWE